MLKKIMFVLLMSASTQLWAGFAAKYRGTADCGIAEAWPRSNFLQPTGTTCNVALTVSPDGRDPNTGRTIGTVEWQVSDMVFTGTYEKAREQMYLDFHGKSYRGYRGAAQTTDRYGRSVVVVDLSRRTTVYLYEVEQ